jgi:hypothetical protein
MGLLTFAFVLAFTLLYISKSLDNKPAFVSNAVDKINQNINMIALCGFLFALVSILLTPVLIYSGANMLIRLLANALIVLMALPSVAHQWLPKYQDKINPAILEEIRNFIGWISKNEKYVGYAGAAASVLMFLIIFA